MAIVRATCYLVIEPKHRYNGSVESITVDRITQTLPQKLGTRHVALKLNIDIDGTLFEQFLPEATVTVSDRRQVIEPEVSVGIDVGEPIAADDSVE